LASFRDQAIKAFDLDLLVASVRDGAFKELMKFKSEGTPIKFCCFLGNKLIIACKSILVF
jgi:hypothetical protein